MNKSCADVSVFKVTLAKNIRQQKSLITDERFFTRQFEYLNHSSDIVRNSHGIASNVSLEQLNVAMLTVVVIKKSHCWHVYFSISFCESLILGADFKFTLPEISKSVVRKIGVPESV